MSNHSINIILCAGSINYGSLPIAEYHSNAMIPVNGKPVIAWILNDLVEKNIFSATIVLREDDHQLKNFITRTYSERMNITLVNAPHEGTIIQSLQAGLKCTPPEELVRIILGDTYIREKYDDASDFVYVGQVEESRRWCIALVDTNGYILDLLDKQENLDSELMLALAGYYHLFNGKYLAKCVDDNANRGTHELSKVLLDYIQYNPIKTKITDQWFDFGNIDNLIKARRRLLQPRHFNELRINPVLNTITKSSENNEKLRDELDWYLQLPDELKILTPRIINHQLINGQLHIIQEYYGYPTLAEVFTYGNLHSDTWISILKQVLRIHLEFCRYQGQIGADNIKTMYVDKTFQRLEVLKQQDNFWRELLTKQTILLNNQELQNIPLLNTKIEARVQNLMSDAPISIIHGDYCFSNILFDINNQIVRLIDPRGSFGQKGIYGDVRYDIAKLRHSVCSLYDFIVNDMYEIRENENGFTTTIYADKATNIIGNSFDQMIISQGYKLDEIRFIEGLLFLSMPPLHKDNFNRQKMMYLTGLRLLNETL